MRLANRFLQTIGIGTGGTGQTAQAAALNALLPTFPTNEDGRLNFGSDGSNGVYMDPFTIVPPLFDDLHCFGNTASNVPAGVFGLAPTGNGGGGIFNAATVAVSAAGRFGLAGLGVGTNSNNNGQGFFFNENFLQYPGVIQKGILQFSAYIPTLATVTNDFTVELGFRNTLTTGLSTNAMAILYQRSSSTNWQAYTSKAGTSTIVTSSTAVAAATWYNFKIVIQSGSVSFYVGAAPGPATTLIGTSTTNLPDSSNQTYLNFTIYRTATFALQRYVVLDWLKWDGYLASQR